jgi:hypothetical protein
VVANGDVWLKGYTPNGDVLFEGTFDEVPSRYEEYTIVSMWSEHDDYSSCISFHLVK